jgi:hypothetical protein
VISVVARYPDDMATLICPGCGFAVRHIEPGGHKRCPWCGGLGRGMFNEKRNGWKVECENRHRINNEGCIICGMNARTHYCYTLDGAWKMWDTRIP